MMQNKIKTNSMVKKFLKLQLISKKNINEN